MRYLLDANVWIANWKRPTDSLALSIAKRNPSELFTCSIVLAELLHGAKKYGNADRRTQKVRNALGRLKSLPFDDISAVSYASVKHDLQIRGLVIGPSDLQIAAICLANDLTLITSNVVTSNVGEFSRVANLRIEDWTTSTL